MKPKPKKYEFSIQTNNKEIFSFEADSYNGLIEAIYANKNIDEVDKILATDAIEVKYNGVDPDEFLWTKNIKPEEPKDAED